MRSIINVRNLYFYSLILPLIIITSISYAKADKEYTRFKNKLDAVCHGKYHNIESLLMANPYATGGKCYLLPFTAVTQLINRTTETVAAGNIIITFDHKALYPYFGPSIVIGNGAFRYTDIEGALRVIPKVLYLTKYVENPKKIAKEKEERLQELKNEELLPEFKMKIKESISKHYTNWNASYSRVSCTIRIELSKNGDLIGMPKVVYEGRSNLFVKKVIKATIESRKFSPPQGLSYNAYKNITINLNSYDLDHGLYRKN